MLFNSYVFIFVFLPLTLFVFYFLGSLGNARLAVGWLVLASIFFYGWWNPVYVGLIIFSLVVNFSIGYYLGVSYEQTKKRRQALLILGLCFNLGLLAYFKYTNFFLGNLNAVFNAHFPNEHIILPLGISFFIFQKVAYLIDAYKGKAREYSFPNFCLFITFFPQLIAGPIVHHSEVMPQFKKSRFVFSHSDLAIGITIFSIGLFKKVMLADNLALYATPVFDMAKGSEPVGSVMAWIGALCFTFQIYFDFSGYSDMAIGLGRMFGIKLPLNFNSPYKAVGIIDFWRRWHMTLSRFLRDYLYIPLGGGRRGKVRRYVNLMVVMILGGLWHGANWTFVLWGTCHGFYLVVNHIWRNGLEKFQLGWAQKPFWRYFAQAITFLCVVIAWVLFRSEDFSTAFRIYQGMFSWPLWADMGSKFFIYGGTSMLAALFMVMVFPNTQELLRDHGPAFDLNKGELSPLTGFLKRLKWSPGISWSVVVSIIFLISFFNMLKVSEFLYFQF